MPPVREDDIVLLRLTDLRVDERVQSRAELDAEWADSIARALRPEPGFKPAIVPPVVAFYDGCDRWLADGFHRYRGHELAGAKYIEVDLRKGTMRDAILFSVGANGEHGRQRTDADKRRAIGMLLTDAEWGKWNDREIARRCAVHHSTVSKYRSLANADSDERLYTSRHGTTSTMRVGNIGGYRSPEMDPARLPEAEEGALKAVRKALRQVRWLARLRGESEGAVWAAKIAEAERAEIEARCHKDKGKKKAKQEKVGA